MEDERILVVDDEKNIRLTLQQVLEDEGLQVETASDGAEALERVRAESFALVLLDLKMPGTGGMEVLRQVRALRPDLPVVVFTAHGSAENATEAMKLGATDFAEKPFSPSQIRALVKGIRGGGAQDEGTEAFDGTASEAGAVSSSARPYTTLVLLSDPATARALLRLAAASAHSDEHGEVIAVGLQEPAAGEASGDGAPTQVDPAAAVEQAAELGVTVRSRPLEEGPLHEVLPQVVQREAPDHVLLEWSAPPDAARALDSLAQQIAQDGECDVTLVRPGARSKAQRIAAVMSEEAHALVALRRALEFAKSAGVASLTLLNVQPPPAEGDAGSPVAGSPVEDGLAFIHQMARQAGLPQDKYYTQVAVAEDVAGALPRVAEDFDTFCISAAHAETLLPALFGDAEHSRIAGTVALVRGPEQTSPTIMRALIDRLAST